MAREPDPPGKTPQDGDRPDDDTGDTQQQDGFAQLRAHHQGLRALLGEVQALTDAAGAGDLLGRLSAEWAAHARAHGRLYEAATEAGLQDFAPLTETAIDTDLTSYLLRAARDLEGPLALAALRVAARLIGAIIEREEKPRSGLLAKARAAGVDPAALGGAIGAMPTPPSGQDGETLPRLRHLTVTQEDTMPRNSNMPERDEYGRFVSDDDRAGRGRGSARADDRDRDSRGRFVSDDDRGGRGRMSRRDDDDYGRGRSSGRYEDDDRRYGRSSRHDDDDRRSGRYDDDRGYSRDRGQGGWFGDSEGHSEAAQLGWQHRRDEDDDDYGRGRSSGRYDDDRRYGRSSRHDDDDRRGSGRYGDDRGSSRDHGQGGWFGDREGHSEAAQRGWDHRRDDDDDYGRGRSSGRYEDDDRRYGRGRR